MNNMLVIAVARFAVVVYGFVKFVNVTVHIGTPLRNQMILVQDSVLVMWLMYSGMSEDKVSCAHVHVHVGTAVCTQK